MCAVWIGKIEAVILASLVESGGSVNYVKVKGEISGYPRLVLGVVPVGEMTKVRYVHSAVAHATRTLCDKTLISIKGRGSRKMLILNWQVLGALAISRTAVGRRELG